MIVITTNNGKSHLERLLNELNNLDLLNHKVLVVDSGSSDIESLNYLENLKLNNSFKYNLTIDKTPYSGYDSGVIIYTIKNYEDDSYIFIHDSFSIKTNEFFTKMDELMNKKNVVVPLLIFNGNAYDNDSQKDFCKSKYGSEEYDSGIFASIFGISKKSLKKINKNKLYIPTNKNESRAMERCWWIIFNKSGLTIEPLEGVYDYNKIIKNEYHYFSKYLTGRQ
jgi:hypothetical protein